jgi:hypothetical protein
MLSTADVILLLPQLKVALVLGVAFGSIGGAFKAASQVSLMS